jgi:hypothetical protein
MSLYDKSSLIQVPSLYKDGTLVSTIPEDRSGDFTVVRGSNLSATRVGEDGYIKKGYENLLLQSNAFNVTPWLANSITKTGGQSGYDGSNDAWLLTSTLNYTGMVQNVSSSGVHTFSAYLKDDNILLVQLRINGSSFGLIDIDLTAGVITGQAGTTIVDKGIESVGNGWYRAYIVVNDSVSSAQVTFNDIAGTSFYIQDAQLNQGLVAYPYLETTTAPVQGGLLENTPRLDWSNGVPAVLVEEQRTNVVEHSEYFDATYWTKLNVSVSGLYESPSGKNDSYKITENNASSAHITYSNSVITIVNGTSYTYSIFAKYDGRQWVRLWGEYGSTSLEAYFDIQNGVLGSKAVGVVSGIEDYGNGWYRIYATATTDGTGGRFRVYLADADGSSAYQGDGASGIYIYGAQLEQGYPTSYIPTYGTTQTRSNEVISDNFDIPTTATIYNSFYSDTAETVFVLDQVFNVAEGLNKVAIAFSPTAVKISIGGSIVANATGTYDTTALSNIQLGSNNGTDYSNAPISGFYVFPEFLTDEELNSLTA